MKSASSARSVSALFPSIAFFFLSFAFSVLSASAGRKGDVVLLRGSTVRDLVGIPIEKIGGYAVRDGAFTLMPVQIDERDGSGDLIYTKYGGGTTGRRDGKLSAGDDIIFLYRDTGEKRKKEPLPPGATGGAEVRVTDPLDGSNRWFYLLMFDGKAPRSDIDYVKYDPGKDVVESFYYTLGFPYREAIQVPSYFSASRAAGGSGRNIYDLYKIDLTVDLKLLGKTRWTQNDFLSVPVGYVDGPLRVSRRIKSAIRLAGPFRGAMVYNDSTYYPYYCSFPSLFQIPFRLASVAHSVTMRISDDLNGNARGMIWYNERNRDGITISGTPSEEAKRLDSGPYSWKLASGPQGTLMSVTVFDPAMAVMKRELYYVDNESKPDEPCQFRGQIGNSGYRLTNIESLPKGNYLVETYVFCPVDYKKGDEKSYLDSITRPLIASASRLEEGSGGREK